MSVYEIRTRFFSFLQLDFLKIRTQKQRKEEGLIVVPMSSGVQAIMVGRQGIRGLRLVWQSGSRDITFQLHTGSERKEQEVGRGCRLSDPPIVMYFHQQGSSS